MAKNDWGDELAAAENPADWGDKPAAQRDLPAGVKPSDAGGGRGKVNPPAVQARAEPDVVEEDALTQMHSPYRGSDSVDARRTRSPGRVRDADIPPLTLESATRDVAAGMLQIGPTAVKGVGDVMRLATGDRVGKSVSEFAERGNAAIRDVVGSRRAAVQREQFAQDMEDPALNAADVIVGNPGALADMALPTVGSMLLPVGAASVANAAATGSRAARVAAAIDPATVAARAAAARTGATVGTVLAQNAGDTFGTVKDEGGTTGEAYTAAAITAPFTYLASRLTGGGAEGQLVRNAAGQNARRTAMSAPAAVVREGGQEAGEQLGQSLGEAVGKGEPLDIERTGKELAVAGTMGAMVGGGVDLSSATIDRLKKAGDVDAAKLLERRATETSVAGELKAMGDAAAHPKFQEAYRAQRTSGQKPAAAAARAGMLTGFDDLADAAGLSEKARAAVRDKVASMPLDQVPGFLERYMNAVTGKGLGKPLEPGTVEGALGAVRDDAMGAALRGLYPDSSAATMDAIEQLEQQQDAPAAPAAAAAPAPAEDLGNDPVLTPEADQVHRAATSPLNDLPEPTEAQKKAGNYAVGRMRLAGLDISVENPQGSVRRGVDADGTAWETPMRDHYGYVRGTTAADGDKLDVFIRPGTPADYRGPVFVVDQVDPRTGAFDEHKVLIGAKDEAEAEAMYRRNYSADWQGLGAITRLPMPAFQAWAKSNRTKEALGDIEEASARRAAAAAPAPVPAPAGAPQRVQPAADGAGRPADVQASAAPAPNVIEQPAQQQQAQLDPDEQRRGFQEAEAKRKAKASRLRAGAYDKNPLMAFVAKHGLSLDLANEFAPGSERRRAIVPGYGPVFRRAGLNIDLLAERAAEEGFLPPGSADADMLYDLIARAFRGERVAPQYTEGTNTELERQTEARFEDYLEQQAEAEDPFAGLDPADLEDTGAESLSEADQQAFRALIEAAEAEGIDTEAILERAAMLAQNGTDEDFRQAAVADLAAARARRAGPAGGEGAQPGREAAEREGAPGGEPLPGEQGEARSERIAPDQPTETPADAGVSASGPLTWEVRPTGTLAIKGDQQQILDTLKAGGVTKTMVMQGGIMVGKTQVQNALAILEGRPVEKKPLQLSVGITPGNAEPVTVRDGMVYIGDAEAIDFESGEPVRVPDGAGEVEIRKALTEAGALSRRQKFFGGGVTPQAEAPTTVAPQEPLPSSDKPTFRADDVLEVTFGEFVVNNADALMAMPRGSWVLTQGEAASYRDKQYAAFYSSGDGRWGSSETAKTPEEAYRTMLTRSRIDPAELNQVPAAEFAKPQRQQDLLGDAPNASQQAAAKARGEADEKAARQRDAAPDPDGFTLTGSDRAADANPGQGDIFSAAPTAAADPFEIADTRARRRAALDILGDGWTAEAGSEGRRDHFKKRVGDVDLMVRKERTVDGEFYVGWHAIRGPRKGQGSFSNEAATLEQARDIAEREAARINDAARESSAAPAATITDLGEKIGGARKDTSQSTGPQRARRDGDDARPTWAKRFDISQIVRPGGQINPRENEGRWVITDKRDLDWMKQPRQVGGRDKTFATREEAEAYLPIAAVAMKHRVRMTSDGKYTIWRTVSDRKAVQVVDRTFDSNEEAKVYMAANAAAILETNTTFGEADLPLPPDRARTGAARRTGNVKGDDFMEAFGFRGVEFGNWNNQDERQALMNDAYDGLMDLAEVLNVPPKAIGLNGELGLAFGARGHGLNSARAHYELQRVVINLTKERGAGSLAHEWFHALDHYFGRQDGKASSKWETGADGTRTLAATDGDMASSGFRARNSGVREELRKAYDALLETMFKKATTYVEDTQKADQFTARTREELARELDQLRAELSAQKDPKYWKRNNKPASAEHLAQFDAIAKRMLDGEALALATEWRSLETAQKRIANRWTNDALEEIGAIYKAVRGRSGFSAERKGTLDSLRDYMTRYSQRLKMLADAQQGTEKKRMTPTDFAMNAKELDQGRGQDYWTTPHEMAARAFQGYVEDKIAGRGGMSRFLNYAPENVGILTPWGFKRPYPAGQERKAINGAFDRFVGEIRTRETDAGTAIYKRGAFSTRGMTVDQVQRIAAPIIGKWKNPPTLRVVQSYRDLPGEHPADVRGLYQRGTVWIVAGAHANSEDALRTVGRTLAHEAIAHHGLRDMLGRDGWDELMRNIRLAIESGNKPLNAIREQVRKTYVDEDGEFNLSANLEADEIAALVVEQAVGADGNFRPGFSFLKATWARIAEFLRSIGIDVKFTHAELQGMLVRAQRHLAAGRRAGPAPDLLVPAAARAEGYAQAVDTAIRAATAGEKAKPGYIDVGTPSPQLLQAGVPDRPLRTSAAILAKAHFDHGVTLSALRQLPDLLDSPFMVFDSDTVPGSFVVVTDKVIRERPLIVAISPDAARGGDAFNFVPSLYPKDRLQAIQGWMDKGLLKWRDESKSPPWFGSFRAPIARGSRPTEGSDGILARGGDARTAASWEAIADTEFGPEYQKGDLQLLPLGERDTSTDLGENSLPLGHAAHVATGNRVYGFAIARAGEIVGEATLEVGPDGQIAAVHDINLTTKRVGTGRTVMEAILATAPGPVRIIDIVPTAEAFWDKMGAGARDVYQNATTDWASYQATGAKPRGDGRGARDDARAEQARPGAGDAAAEGQAGDFDEGVRARAFADRTGPATDRLIEPWQVAVAPRLATALRRWESGKFDEKELAAAVRAELDERQAKRDEATARERVRGADWVKERLLRARRTGEMSDGEADLALWVLEQSPQLAVDLGISIREGDESKPNGMYNAAARVVTIFTSKSNSETTTHEILHHTERMMPDEVQAGIRREWLKQLTSTAEAAKKKLQNAKPEKPGWTSVDTLPDAQENANRIVILDWMLEAARRGDYELTMALWKGRGKIDLQSLIPYQFASPSEFWAVNGARILRQRYTAEGMGWVARARRWLQELMQKAKDLLGLQSDAPVLRGLQAVLDGDGSRRSPDMIAGGKVAEDRTAAQADLFRADTWSAPEPTRTDAVIYELQDGRVDLKRVQQAIASAGREIEEQFDPRLAETLYPGRVAYRTEVFLDAEVKPLLQAMATAKVDLDELGDYLIARHAPERNAQVAKVNPDLPDGGAGRNSKGELMTNEAAAAYLAGIPPERRAQLAELAARVDRITAGTRGLLVAEGLEKQSTIDAWNGAYEHYVPLFKDETEHPHPQGTGFTVKGPASKRATGSTREVTHVLAHVFMQREAAIARAEKNKVGLALYGLALSNPNPEFWTTIKPSMSNEQIGRELLRMGVDPTVAEAGMRGIPTITMVDPITQKKVERPNPIYKNLPGAITLKVNGEDRVLMLNVKNERAARMAEALKNLDGLTKFDLAGSIIGKATRWIAAVNTQYNPAFGLVNLTRDVLGGSINLGSTPLRGNSLKVLAQVPMAMQGIARELAGGGQGSEWSKLWKQFQDDGGRTGYRDVFAQADDRAKAIEAELAQAERMGKLTPGTVGHAVLDLLDGFNTTLENAVRLSAYKAGLDQGLSRAQAARIGRELTVDFNRKGRIGREVGPLYAFFNASVQGGARTIQALKGPTGAKIVAGGLALGGMQALMLLAAGYDEDEIPEFVKTRALIIPLPRKDGEKRFISIPYPLGLHVLPNTGRVATELALNGGKDTGRRVFNAVGEIAGAFNPLGGGNIFTADGALKTVAPTLADPLIEVAANKNFAGRPIEKESPRGEADNRPGYQRAKESTLRSPTGQAYLGISRAINALTGGTAYEAGLASPTPERVRYIAQVAGGGVLREFEKSVDGIIKTARAEDVKPSGIPVFGRFYGEVDDDQVAQSRYYERGKRLDQLQGSLKAAQAAGDGEAMTRMLEQHPEAAMIALHDRVHRELAKLNKLAVATVDDPTTIKAIDEARVAQMRVLNEAVEQLEAANAKATLGQRLRGVLRPQEVAGQ
jgi:hypothetical protein